MPIFRRPHNNSPQAEQAPTLTGRKKSYERLGGFKMEVRAFDASDRHRGDYSKRQASLSDIGHNVSLCLLHDMEITISASTEVYT